MPIIVLSARTGEMDKVTGLELGAEDYVAKPFSLAKLLARVRAALRRGRPAPPAARVVTFGDVTIDLAQAKTVPNEVAIYAYAGLRDVDVLVGRNTHVELSGRANNDHLRSDVPAVPEDLREHVVRVHGHTALGDVTVRIVADGLP